MNNNLFFIGGSGRSGTTVLTKIFSKHPSFSVVPEWRFLVDPDGILDFYTNVLYSWTPYSYSIKLRRLEQLLIDIGNENPFGIIFEIGNKLNKKLIKSNYNFTPRYLGIKPRQFSPNYAKLTKKLIANLTDFSYYGIWSGTQFLDNGEILYKGDIAEIKEAIREFIFSIKQDVLNHQGKKYYLEKNTWNILWFERIYNLFPEAKLVHIYRDPRDVISSFSRQSWMPDNPVQCAYIYSDIMKKWQQIKKEIPAKNFFELSLEQLVIEPESNLKKICEFWNVEWNANLLNVELNKSNTGRWKNDLDYGILKKIEEIVKEELQLYVTF